MTTNQDGASLLELLISMSLTLVISTSVLGITNQFVHRAAADRYSALAFFAERKLTALIRLGITQQASHRLFAPRIHQSGKITLGSGKLLRLAGPHAPFHLSDAISFMQLRIADSFWIHNAASGLYACARFNPHAQLKDIRSFLVISSDGLAEAIGKATGNGRCRHFSLRLSDGIFFDADKIKSISFARVIIPIERTTTLYLDKHQELRYLSTAGTKIIENQPISKGLLQFKLSYKSPTIQEPATILLMLQSKQRQRQLELPLTTSPINHFHLLMLP